MELDLLAKPFKTGFDIDKRDIPRDAIITGYGKVNGRRVYAACYDYTTVAGSQGFDADAQTGQNYGTGQKGRAALRLDHRFLRSSYSGSLSASSAIGCRFRVDDCGEGNLDMFGPPMSSGIIPQISLMLGPAYAGTAYCPMMSDFLIFRKELSFMSVASPTLLKTATGADVTQDEIGGARLHAEVTGSADLLVDSDEEALAKCRELLGYLPSNWTEKPP